MSLAPERGERPIGQERLTPRSGARAGNAVTHGLRHGLLSFALRAECVYLGDWRGSPISEISLLSCGAPTGLAER